MSTDNRGEFPADVHQFLTPVRPDGGQVVTVPDPADAARVRYQAAEDALAYLLEDLYVTTEPADRAGFLLQMRDQAIIQADVHFAVFGPTPVGPNTVGAEDMSGSLTLTAVLLDCLAGVEATRGEVGPRPVVSHPAARQIEAHAGPVLDQMTTADVDTMCHLMGEDLYDALVDIVGEQAAEVLVTIADTVPQSDGRGGVMSALQDAPAPGVPLVAIAVVAVVCGVVTAAAYLAGQRVIAALIVVATAVVIAEWLRRSAVKR